MPGVFNSLRESRTPLSIFTAAPSQHQKPRTNRWLLTLLSAAERTKLSVCYKFVRPGTASAGPIGANCKVSTTCPKCDFSRWKKVVNVHDGSDGFRRIIGTFIIVKPQEKSRGKARNFRTCYAQHIQVHGKFTDLIEFRH